MTRLSARFTAAVVVACLCAAGVAAFAQMPFDLAYSRRSLAADRVSISRDGKAVAYTVFTPPAKGPSQNGFLPKGMPAFAVGSGVHLLNTTNGQDLSLGPEGRTCWRPSLSGDGARVAFYCEVDGSPRLWVYDRATRLVRQVSDAVVKAKLWVGDEPVWSGDGRELFVALAPPLAEANATQTLRADSSRVAVRVQRAGAEFGAEAAAAESSRYTGMARNNSSLVGIDVSSGQVRTIAPANAAPPPSVLQLSPSGKWIAYLSVFHTGGQDLAVVPAAGGPIRTVVPDIRLAAYPGGYYLYAYVWHPTRDQVLWMKDGRLWTADVTETTIAPKQLALELTDVTVNPLTFTQDGSAAVVGIHSLDLHDYYDPVPQALAVVPLNGGPAKVLAIPQGLLFQSVVTQRPATLWQPRSNEITVVCRDRATIETTMVRFDLGSGQPSVVQRGLDKVRFEGASADQQLLIGAYEDANTPGNLYRFGSDLSRKERLTDVEPRLAGVRFGPVETFETVVPQFDGSLRKVTSAVLLPPGGKRGDRLAMLVFFYPGGDEARASRDFGGGSPATVPVSIFTTRGYAVLLVDTPIGPEGKGGNPVAEMLDVVLPQVYHAVELGYGDPNRLAISGQSYGGYGTAAMITGTNIFRAAVAISGNYDLPGTYGGGRWAERGQGRMGTHPWADLQRYLDNSPYYHADRIRTPLLLIAGQNDGSNTTDARKMFDALKRLDRTVQHAEYGGEGHVVLEWSLASATDVSRRIVEFLDKYTRGSAAASASR